MHAAPAFETTSMLSDALVILAAAGRFLRSTL